MMVAQIAKRAGTRATMKMTGIESWRMVVSQVTITIMAVGVVVVEMGVPGVGGWFDGGVEGGTGESSGL